MSELIYIDTNVWLDYLFNRKDRYRSLGEIAFELFRRTVSCEFTVVISDLLITELRFNITESQLEEMLSWLNPKIIFVESTKSERRNKVSNDYLHYDLALKSKATCVVTRNLKDFPLGKIPLKLPEQI